MLLWPHQRIQLVLLLLLSVELSPSRWTIRSIHTNMAITRKQKLTMIKMSAVVLLAYFLVSFLWINAVTVSRRTQRMDVFEMVTRHMSDYRLGLKYVKHQRTWKYCVLFSLLCDETKPWHELLIIHKNIITLILTVAVSGEIKLTRNESFYLLTSRYSSYSQRMMRHFADSSFSNEGYV